MENNEFIDKAKQKIEKVNKEKSDALKMFDEFSELATDLKRKLYELKKEYESVIEAKNYLEKNLENIDKNIEIDKIEENVVKEEKETKPKKSTSTSSKKNTTKKEEEKPEELVEEQVAEEKSPVSEDEDIFDDEEELDLDADDIFGDNLDVEIDNIEF